MHPRSESIFIHNPLKIWSCIRIYLPTATPSPPVGRAPASSPSRAVWKRPSGCGTVKLSPSVCRLFFSPYFRSFKICLFSCFLSAFIIFIVISIYVCQVYIFLFSPDNLTYKIPLPRMPYLNFTPPKFHNPHQNMSGVIYINSDIGVSPSPDSFTSLPLFWGKFHCFCS